MPQVYIRVDISTRKLGTDWSSRKRSRKAYKLRNFSTVTILAYVVSLELLNFSVLLGNCENNISKLAPI